MTKFAPARGLQEPGQGVPADDGSPWGGTPRTFAGSGRVIGVSHAIGTRSAGQGHRAGTRPGISAPR